MSSLKRTDIVECLSEICEPAPISIILRHFASNRDILPSFQLQEALEEALSTGVRCGYVQQYNEYYYTVSAAMDALYGDGKGDNDEEVELNFSVESIASGLAKAAENKTKVDVSKNGKGDGQGNKSEEDYVVPTKKPKLEKSRGVQKDTLNQFVGDFFDQSEDDSMDGLADLEIADTEEEGDNSDEEFSEKPQCSRDMFAHQSRKPQKDASDTRSNMN